MLTCQVKGHQDKMARTKNQHREQHKTLRTPRRNKHFFSSPEHEVLSELL